MNTVMAWKTVAASATVRLTKKGGCGVLVPGGFILTAAHCVEWSATGGMALGDYCMEPVETRQGAKFMVSVCAVEPVPAYVALGVGGVGLIAGTVFGVIALSDRGTLKGECSSSNACPSSAQADISGLHAHEWISDIGFAVGLVGAGVGTWLLLAGPSGNTTGSPDTGMRVQPLVGVGSVGLRGSFQ